MYRTRPIPRVIHLPLPVPQRREGPIARRLEPLRTAMHCRQKLLGRRAPHRRKWSQAWTVSEQEDPQARRGNKRSVDKVRPLPVSIAVLKREGLRCSPAATTPALPSPAAPPVHGLPSRPHAIKTPARSATIAIWIQAWPGPRRGRVSCGRAVSCWRACAIASGAVGVPAASSSVPRGAAAGSAPGTLSPVRPLSISARNLAAFSDELIVATVCPRSDKLWIIGLFQHRPDARQERDISPPDSHRIRECQYRRRAFRNLGRGEPATELAR
jgi:hypothetical protein